MADAQLDRRCAVCKVAMNHTRGAHAVTSQEAAFYCSGKCRRRARRGQEAAGAVARIRLDDEAALYPPSGGPLDWLQLPRNIVKEVQGRLELPDLLQMAQACKAWLSCMAEGMASVALHGCQDTRGLSNTVYLLDRLLPAVTSLSLTLPSTEDASRRVQVLSRATRLEHLQLRMQGSVATVEWPIDEQLQALPALARLTRLRSLTFAAPMYMYLSLCALAPLTGLTRLCLTHSDGLPIRRDHEFADAVDVLAALPLEHLEVVDCLLPTTALSRLTRLTHLTVTDLPVFFDNHGGALADDPSVCLEMYFTALASLPRLRVLALVTCDDSGADYFREDDVAVATVWTAKMAEAAARCLATVPELRLDIGKVSCLQATPDTMAHLARLTNLTSLRLVLAGWHDAMATGMGLGMLGALTHLQQLSLDVRCVSKAVDPGTSSVDETGANAVVVREHQLRAVCLQLQRLTRLRLGLRPCWLWPGPTALRHLSKLRSLRDLSLRLPSDSYRLPMNGEESRNVSGLLREYVPSSVDALHLADEFHLL